MSGPHWNLMLHMYTPVEHPAERHTAADAGAGELCGAARCSPAASGDAVLHG